MLPDKTGDCNAPSTGVRARPALAGGRRGNGREQREHGYSESSAVSPVRDLIFRIDLDMNEGHRNAFISFSGTTHL